MAISYADSLRPFIVLDKNQFRGVNAANTIADARSQNCQILLIDTVFVEIASAASKGKDWKDQFEKDFRDWVKNPKLLVVARGFGELLRLERDSGASALPALVDSAMTTVIQDAIRDLGVSGVGGLAKYDARMADGKQSVPRMLVRDRRLSRRTMARNAEMTFQPVQVGWEFYRKRWPGVRQFYVMLPEIVSIQLTSTPKLNGIADNSRG